MADDIEGDEPPQISQTEKEDRAKRLGWAPKDRWKGDPDHWVDADRYLEISETSLPLIKSQLRKAQEHNDELRQRFNATQSDFERRLRASEAAARKALDLQKRNLIDQFEDEKRAALTIEDPQVRRAAYDGAARRERDALGTIIREESELEQKFAPQQQQQQNQIPEEVAQWGKKNPWVNYVPQEMRIEAVEVMNQLDQSSPEMGLTEKLDTVTAVMRRRHPQWFPPDQVQARDHNSDDAGSRNVGSRRPVSAVEGGSGISGGRAAPKVKSFKDLPGEAKSAFNDLMREGRLGRPRAGQDEAKFKADMEKEYASTYWSEYGD